MGLSLSDNTLLNQMRTDLSALVNLNKGVVKFKKLHNFHSVGSNRGEYK